MAANNGESAEISNLNPSRCNFSIGERFESEIPDSSYSLSLPSEPPDLRNWFSSYVYESPELDTGDGFSPGESQINSFSLEGINRHVSLAGGRNSLNEVDGCQRFRDDDNQENQGLNKRNHLLDSNENQFSKNGCSDESLEGKKAQSHDFIPLKDDKKAYLSGRNDPLELDEIEDDALASLKANKELPEELLEKRIAEETQVDRTSSASVASTKKSIRSSDDKENEGKVLASDGGFISTRKNRIIRETDGKYNRRNRVIDENLRNENMISSIDGKAVGVVRKVLSERTNIQCEPIVEIAGKWQYPRRNKADLGPPLKQLRLEQWVHRV